MKKAFQGSALPDVVVRHEYDDLRRRTRSWLPVSAPSGGGYVSGAAVATLAVSQYTDTAPFTRAEYDGFLPSQPSALHKAGTQWQGNGKKTSVTYSEYVGTGMYDYVSDDGGEYIYTMPDMKYLRAQTVDEDGRQHAEYTDMSGRLAISETGQGRTYYIYDVRGDVRYVVPPALSAYILSCGEDMLEDTDVMIRKYAYVYRYDNRRHCVYKKLPGCEPIYYVYDRTGACVLTQDGAQRQRGEWTYTIPDRFGRPCVSGVCHNSVSYAAEPLRAVCVYAEYDGVSAQTGGYTVHNLTLDTPALHTAAYYDGYSFVGSHGVPSSLAVSAVPGYPVDTSLGRGLRTGSATAMLSGGGVTGYTYSAVYYDSRYNVSQVRATNVLGGVDVTCTSYSYTGKPLGVRTVHTGGTDSVVAVRAFAYDGRDRLLSVTHSVNGSTPVTLASYTYDALGRVTTKTTGGLETTTYTYNIQSWPVKISGQRFTERLCYNDAVEGLAPALAHQYRWNGTVAAYGWNAGGETRQRGYSLLYDGQDRLTAANYGEGWNLTAYHTKYDEKAEYDVMGNPVWIYRKSPLTIDETRPSSPSDRLRLEYDGNQLVHVTDTVTSGHNYEGAFHFADGADQAVEYEYDGNGNMTKDLNRNISSIEYNLLNLPSMVKFGDNHYIFHTYSASGEKLMTQYQIQLHPVLSPRSGDGVTQEADGVSEAVGTRSGPLTPIDTDHIYYCGDMVYDRGVTRLLTDEGYVTFSGTGAPVYHYYLRDHLGNVRVVMGQTGNIEQVNHYYAFGGLMRESTSPGLQPYKYGGKELDRYAGLDAYDFGARSYFADRMQWSTMDPLCEKYYNVSPYAYCGNNPVMLVDSDGNSPFSALVKIAAKKGIRVGIKTYIKNNIEHRLKNYMSKDMLKQFAKDVDEVVGALDNTWWENALELVPIAGDIYGTSKFAKQMRTVYDKLQDLENKYVGEIYRSLSKDEQIKFVRNMRRKGVADARKDQAKDLHIGGGIKYEKGKNIDGHHKESVSEHKDKMTDPRVVEFMEEQDYIIYHRLYGNK